jgi:hypothetical protein
MEYRRCISHIHHNCCYYDTVHSQILEITACSFCQVITSYDASPAHVVGMGTLLPGTVTCDACVMEDKSRCLGEDFLAVMILHNHMIGVMKGEKVLFL